MNNKQYRRIHVIPANPMTVAQQANRSKFAQAILSWQGLPLEDKDTWREYAKYLEVRMSGYNLYIRLYMLFT